MARVLTSDELASLAANEGDWGRCQLCDTLGTEYDPCAEFWDASKPEGDESVIAHGECGFDRGLELA